MKHFVAVHRCLFVWNRLFCPLSLSSYVLNIMIILTMTKKKKKFLNLVFNNRKTKRFNLVVAVTNRKNDE